MYTEKYQHYNFRGDKLAKTDDFEGFWLVAFNNNAKSEKDYLFKETTKITGLAISIKYNNIDTEKIIEELKQKTISKAKARINLNLYDNGKEYFQEITTSSLEESYNNIDDVIIQKWILAGLNNLRKNDPTNYKFEKFDVDGFCNLFMISQNQYIYNASILLEDNLVEKSSFQQDTISNGGLYITSNGIRKIPIKKEKKLKYEEVKNEIIPAQSTNNLKEEYKYDIALSFAGEDREIAKKLANKLKKKQIRIFYDDFEKSELWDKNLYEYLGYIYNDAARFCIIFISKNYEKKNWTNHERQFAQARAFRENTEYILPIKLDDTRIPGLAETVGYISINDYTIEEIANLIEKKLNSVK